MVDRESQDLQLLVKQRRQQGRGDGNEKGVEEC